MNKVRTGKKEEGRKMNSHNDKACQSIGCVMDKKDKQDKQDNGS